MPRFTAPRDIYYGRESIERLSALRGKRAMLIAASVEMEQNGFLRRAEAALLRTGMKVCTLEFNWPSRVEETAAEGAAAADDVLEKARLTLVYAHGYAAAELRE